LGLPPSEPRAMRPALVPSVWSCRPPLLARLRKPSDTSAVRCGQRVHHTLWVAAAGAAAAPLVARCRRRSLRDAARAATTCADCSSAVLQDIKNAEVVRPLRGHPHTCTVIYLHGYARFGRDYLEEGWCLPWMRGADRAPGLRAVFPNAGYLRQPWGEKEPSWYAYAEPNRNRVGDPATLAATRRRLAKIVRAEVARLGGAASRVFLGGLSQGCTVALDVYLRAQASDLGLGGFVGSVGFLPTDGCGFSGAGRAMQALAAHRAHAARPLWLQCATDDRQVVPWKSLVKPSLRRAEGRLLGLAVREVWGRGHNIDDWECHIINDFFKQYARDAYC